MIDTDLNWIKERLGLNIKSGRIIIQAKDRDRLLLRIESLEQENRTLREYIKNSSILSDISQNP